MAVYTGPKNPNECPMCARPDGMINGGVTLERFNTNSNKMERRKECKNCAERDKKRGWEEVEPALSQRQ